MSACILEMPVVLRVSVLKYGAQHSRTVRYGRHIPGLQVVFPSTPYDAKEYHTALAGSGRSSSRVNAFMISANCSRRKARDYYEVLSVLGSKKNGKDITLITVGATRRFGSRRYFEQKYGLTADVLDCRSINPLITILCRVRPQDRQGASVIGCL